MTRRRHTTRVVVTSSLEAYVSLVGSPVFKTGERRYPPLAGSIPVRLRQVFLSRRTMHGRRWPR
jgi:hypothetical protein